MGLTEATNIERLGLREGQKEEQPTGLASEAFQDGWGQASGDIPCFASPGPAEPSLMCVFF